MLCRRLLRCCRCLCRVLLDYSRCLLAYLSVLLLTRFCGHFILLPVAAPQNPKDESNAIVSLRIEQQHYTLTERDIHLVRREIPSAGTFCRRRRLPVSLRPPAGARPSPRPVSRYTTYLYLRASCPAPQIRSDRTQAPLVAARRREQSWKVKAVQVSRIGAQQHSAGIAALAVSESHLHTVRFWSCLVSTSEQNKAMCPQVSSLLTALCPNQFQSQ